MKSNDRWKIKGMGRGGYRQGAGRKKGTRDGARTEVAEQIALTGRTPLEVMMEAMGHYQEVGTAREPYPLPGLLHRTCTRAFRL